MINNSNQLHFNSKVSAMEFGITAHTIDKLRHYGSYTVARNSYKHTKVKFKKGDILTYAPDIT